MTAPNTDRVVSVIGEIREVLAEIERDYPRAHDEAYGLTRRGEESGRTGHSDPTAEAALARDAMKRTCVMVSQRLSRLRRDADVLQADLDSSLRQSDDPRARAVRVEMRDQARIATREERAATQAERDRTLSAELQGRAKGRRQKRILNGWRDLSDRVAR